VVWTRAFTPVLKTQVYSFAMIVFAYLGATFLGSALYRRDLQVNRQKSKAMLLAALAVMAFVPVLVNTPGIMRSNYWSPTPQIHSAILLLAGIVPFCALLGYLTPGLIDEYAGGNPSRAGRAYAINVLGCILGPLFACYLLLPNISERYSLILLALPFLPFCLRFRRQYSGHWRWALPAVLAIVLAWSTWGTKDYETMFQKDNPTGAEVRRDYAATVISYGQGMEKNLLVNGMGMTILTPITKFMVDLPLALHQKPPTSVLIVCFGMGTTFRSAMSWDIDTTAVELVPSVAKAFGYYHADAASFLSATNGHIVVDDGRRFLKRTTEQFDVIVVDPPPPVQAAGSSLLFSKEFYQVAKRHLKPGGILQMWYPAQADPQTGEAVLRSIHDSFPYVRCFRSYQGWGLHMLGSMEPIENLDATQLAARMPERARRDLLEWNPGLQAPTFLNMVLTNEISVPDSLDPNPAVVVTDDRPFNEYFLLRDLSGG
jgi:spermidine synthase